MDKNKLLQQAQQIIQSNEQDSFIMPDKNYYEGAWLWDTGFIELGASYLDPQKSAQRFINWLEQTQWSNGFIPHILFFSEKVEKYFPGPDFWQTAHLTSGITQPPVLGFCALIIYRNLKEKSTAEAQKFIDQIYPRLLQYHHWLIQERDPDQTGLLSIFHPWESGMDNSPRWEQALSQISVTPEQIEEAHHLRKDLNGLNGDVRPTDQDYARYIWLVRFMVEKNYRNLYSQIPFNIKDILFNSVFYVSNEVLLSIKPDDKIKNYLVKQKKAILQLYNGLFYDLDTKTNQPIKRSTAASFAPLITGLLSSETL